MSLIVLYFLHSTSVLSFNIDVVLTLSISKRYNTSVKFTWVQIHAMQARGSQRLSSDARSEIILVSC